MGSQIGRGIGEGGVEGETKTKREGEMNKIEGK
jgi:hypothetical protein